VHLNCHRGIKVGIVGNNKLSASLSTAAKQAEDIVRTKTLNKAIQPVRLNSFIVLNILLISKILILNVFIKYPRFACDNFFSHKASEPSKTQPDLK
jgi:hypothetical protein